MSTTPIKAKKSRHEDHEGSTKLVRLSTAHQVADRVQEMIGAGQLKLGLPLSEQALADMMDVSRTSVRTALQILQQLGLVEIEPYRGAKVFRPTVSDIIKLNEFRSSLECLALRLSVVADPSSLERALLKQIELTEEILETGDIANYGRIDTSFHDSIFQTCPNEYVKHAYAAIASRLSVMRNLMNVDLTHVELSNRGHAQIASFAASGDFDAAVEALQNHIRRGSSAFCRHLAEILQDQSEG